MHWHVPCNMLALLHDEPREPMNDKTKRGSMTPAIEANPTLERLTAAIEQGMKNMELHTEEARRTGTVAAAIKVCADSQTLTGDVLEAGAVIPFAIVFEEILDRLEIACAVVLDVAANQQETGDRQTVNNYARNIAMRFRILERLSETDRDSAVKLATEYRLLLEAAKPQDLDEMLRDAARIAAPRR